MGTFWNATITKVAVAATFIAILMGSVTPLNTNQVAYSSALLTAEPLNPACDANIEQVEVPACASFELPMGGFTQVTLLLEYTFSTASAVHMFTDGSIDAAVPWGIEQVGDGGAVPTITMGDEDVVWNVTGSRAWMITLTDLNAPYVRWRFVGTGAGVGDTLSAWLIRRGP